MLSIEGGQPLCGDPVVMLVDDWVEALGFGGPYSALVFSGLFTLRRRQKDCNAMQKHCRSIAEAVRAIEARQISQ